MASEGIVEVDGHGRKAFTRESQKGHQWEYSLCPDCVHYMENGIYGCAIATELLAFNLVHKVTTVIWECPEFESK